MTPKVLTRDQLVNVLQDMIEGIKNNDSFDGTLTYSYYDEEYGAGENEFSVYAHYRCGNREGQGGMIIIEGPKQEPIGEPETVLLQGSAIEVGHCIILNDIEQPCGRLIAVVVDKTDDSVYCKYLSSDLCLDQFNKSKGMNIAINSGLHIMTPVEHFGVRIVCEKGPEPKYWCEKVRSSYAKYPDGTDRQWQEYYELLHEARPEVLSKCLTAQLESNK